MASDTSHGKMTHQPPFDFKCVQLTSNWEDVMCPICMDFPHNVVLLQCTSYNKGCRPFMCDTDYAHSNCLDRFITAYGVRTKVPLSSDLISEENIESLIVNASVRLSCPLCRGEVTGWVIVDEARGHLNMKKRCCEEENCSYVGNYSELQNHAKLDHPHAQKSKINPARQIDWENFQQSSETIDALNTILSDIPNGVIIGDYIIDHGEDAGRDAFSHGDDGNRCTCILHQVIDKFRAYAKRWISRAREMRRGHR